MLEERKDLPDGQANQMSDQSSEPSEEDLENEPFEAQNDAAVEHEEIKQDQENGQIIVPEAEEQKEDDQD